MLPQLLWLAAGLQAQVQGPARARAVPPDDRRTAVAPFKGSRFCEYDRIMAGPGQSGFVVWAGDNFSITGLREMLPPSAMLFGRLSSGPNGADQLFTLGGQGLRLFPIRWSTQGDKLYVRVRERRGRIASVSPDGTLLPGEAELAPAWKFVDFQASSYGNVD